MTRPVGVAAGSPVGVFAPAPGVEGLAPWGRVEPRAANLERRPDLLIIGAGLLGLSVAAAAVRAGIGRVQVVERSTIVGGASGRNAGALIPDVHAGTNPPALTALQRRGLALHRDQAPRLGYPLRALDWVVGTATDDGRDAAVHRATGGRVQVANGRIVPNQAATDPVAFARALCRAVDVATGIAVTGITHEPRLTVETTAGPLQPGRVVVAVGNDPFASAPGTYVAGHLAVTAPLATPLPVGISAEIAVVPLADGRLVVGGTRDGERRDGRIDPSVTDRIRRTLDRLVPEAAGVGFEQVWTGQRPVSTNELPVVACVEPGVVVVSGLFHTGVLTSPALGEGIVDFLARSRWPQLLEPFVSDAVSSPGRQLAHE